MFTNHYFVELYVKDREKQLLEEARRIHLLKAAKTSISQNRNRIFMKLSMYFKDSGLPWRKKHEQEICGCPLFLQKCCG
jgi:hypothetical protein